MTDADAILRSKNNLNYNVGIEHGNQGWITKKSPKLQHFSVVQGTCGVEGTVSFESVTRTGSFLRHQGFKIFLYRFEETELYKNDACFYPRYDKYFEVSSRSKLGRLLTTKCFVTTFKSLYSNWLLNRQKKFKRNTNLII